MNFYEIIKAIMLELEAGSETFLYPDERYESETLNFKKFPVCVIETGISNSNTAAQNGNANETSSYQFRVVTRDKWDNWDAENNKGATADGNSYQLYLEMKALANSVMQKFRFQTKFSTNDAFSWNTTPLFKGTSNNLTGVLVSVTFTVPTIFNC